MHQWSDWSNHIKKLTWFLKGNPITGHSNGHIFYFWRHVLFLRLNLEHFGPKNANLLHSTTGMTYFCSRATLTYKHGLSILIQPTVVFNTAAPVECKLPPKISILLVDINSLICNFCISHRRNIVCSVQFICHFVELFAPVPQSLGN